jgi:O-antigen/teichoic acid export membrane protein
LIRRIARDSFTYGIAGTASRFVSALLVPIYVRLFGPEQYGQLELLLAAYTILLLVSGLQVESGVAREYYEAKQAGRLSLLIGTGISLYLVSWIVVAGCVLYFRVAGIGQELLGGSHVYAILVLLLPAQLLGLAMLRYRFERRAALFGTIAVGDIISSGLLTIAAVRFFGMGVEGALWAQVCSKVGWCIFAFSPQGSDRSPAWSRSEGRAILSFGLPLVPSVLATWGQTYANRFLLAAHLPLAAVGVFGLAAKVAMVLALVNTAFSNAWLPYVIENARKPGGKEQVARLFDLYLWGAIVVAFGIMALAPLLIAVIAPPEYSAAVDLVGFILMGLVWVGAHPILGAGLLIARKSYWNAPVFVIGAGVNLGVLWLLVPRYGVLAASASYLLGAVISGVLFYFLSRKIERIPFRRRAVVAGLLLTFFSPLFWYFIRTGEPSIGDLLVMVPLRLSIALLLSTLAFFFILGREERWRLLAFLREIWRRSVTGLTLRSSAHPGSDDSSRSRYRGGGTPGPPG